MQHTYGGDQERWFKMRPAYLYAYAEMMPRVRASHLLDMYDVVAAATGSMKKGAAQQIVNKLQMQKAGIQSEAPVKESRVSALPIKLHKHSPKKKEGGDSK